MAIFDDGACRQMRLLDRGAGRVSECVPFQRQLLFTMPFCLSAGTFFRPSVARHGVPIELTHFPHDTARPSFVAFFVSSLLRKVAAK